MMPGGFGFITVSDVEDDTQMGRTDFRRVRRDRKKLEIVTMDSIVNDKGMILTPHYSGALAQVQTSFRTGAPGSVGIVYL